MSIATVGDTQEETIIGPDEVKKRIPHRYPFLLVDRATDYRPMKSIRGFKNVTFNEPFFEGHFPAMPIMPGVLIVESLAQTGAILMSKSLDVDVSRHTIFFMSVDKARFRHPVRPGDTLEMPVEVLIARRGVFKFRGYAMVGGERAADAEFAAKVHELPE
ncbi:MAG: 3-hydroxyacyl-ACP dehydratase FabZ [Caulobacterales bacterium]|nr:3-hydroxyacyl-ACP dehydratase FabZ [Caulobacterales bacterium]